MLVIRNRIADYNDGKQRDRKGNADRIVIHRLDFSVGQTAEEIATAFRDRSKYAAGSYTGGQWPYTFVVWPDCVDQALRLSDVGPHAGRWNQVGIGVAVMGDFTKHVPTTYQIKATIDLCWSLCLPWRKSSVVGHTELKGASADPQKVCPGPFFPLNYVRQAVKEHLSATYESVFRLYDPGAYGIIT